jgi:branched-chain amino acid transport system substrate-binding protein
VSERPEQRLGRWALTLGLLLLVAFWIFSHTHFYPRMRERREERALAATGPVQIAAVWPPDQGEGFFNGVRLAVGEANIELAESGRSMVVHELQEPTVSKGLRVARQVARNLDYVAVIGHYRREVALPASITYETTGTLFLVTGTTSHMMTRHGFEYLLQTSPEDTQLAGIMAATASRLSLSRVAVVFVRSLYGEQLSRSVVQACIEAEGTEIVFWSSYPANVRSFLPMLAELRSASPDGIVIVDGLQRAETLIREIRTMGIDIPILGGPALEDHQLLQSLGSMADNLYVLSPFRSRSASPGVSGFVARYQDRYDSEPDYQAALAYEMVKLLAQAIARTGETTPISMVTTLKYGGEWQCLDGPCSFLDNGLIAERQIFVKEAHNGEFTEVKESTGGS